MRSYGDTRLDLAPSITVCPSLGENSLAQYPSQTIDVSTRASLGDRDKQAPAVLIAARERMKVRAGIDARGGATPAHGGNIRVETHGNSRTTGWECSGETPSSAHSASRA